MSFTDLPLLLHGAALAFPEPNPFLLTIPEIGPIGPFPIRWYALAYIGGILLGWQYAAALARRDRLWPGNTSPVTVEDIGDLIFWVTVGIILGGRLGYIFFYQIPFEFDRFLADPAMALRIWQGGMSFHGGLIGVALALVFGGRARGVPLLSIGDIAGVVAPIGILFGRLANFINAELYGRTTSAGIGMVFPEGRVPGMTPPAYDTRTNEWVYTGAELPRHPSQLYEAALEGLLPLLVLSLLIWRFGALKRPGLVAGLFLLMYGVGRSVAENFREPDAFASGLPGGITMGMLLSLPMWVGGALLVWFALRGARPPARAAGA